MKFKVSAAAFSRRPGITDMKATWMAAAISGALLVAGACASTSSQPPANPAKGSSASATSERAETNIAVSDTSGGADLSFTGPPGEVQNIRARVRALAEKHNAQVSSGTAPTMHCPCATIVPTGCCGMLGHPESSTNSSDGCCAMMGGQGHGMMGGHWHGMIGDGGCDMGQAAMSPVASNATVRDVEGGAVMSLTPTTPADAAALRQQVHMCVDHVQRGGCPMMQH
jgi:hypothetical protein